MKGQSEEEKRRILAIAGNPHNGQVQPLNSIPDAYRILVRSYYYNKKTKRGDGNKHVIGVVINGEFLSSEQYHQRYTRMGRLRPVLPSAPKRRGRPPRRAAAQADPIAPTKTPSHGTSRTEADQATAGTDTVTADAKSDRLTTETTSNSSARQPRSGEPAKEPQAPAANLDPTDLQDAAKGASTPAPAQSIAPHVMPTPWTADDPCIYERMLGAVPILYQTAVNCGIVDDLRAAFEHEVIVNEILSLAFHWLIDGNNAAQRYPDFSSCFALPHLGRLEEDELSQFYATLSTAKPQITRLFKLRLQRLPKGTRVSYDSTTIPTEASDIYLAAPGKSQEGEIRPLAHLALLVDQETRQPLLYRLFGGNTPDCRNFEDLLHRLEELGTTGNDIKVVCDRGYENTFNLLLATQYKEKVLMAASNLREEYIDRILRSCTDMWDACTCIPGTTIHGRTVQVTLKICGQELKLWVHIYRDSYQTVQAEASLQRQLAGIEQRWNATAVKDRHTLFSDPLMSYFKWPKLDGPLVRDNAAIDEKLRFAGYFANVSNFELNCAEALAIYKQRDSIEKCFKAGKMGVKLNVARAHREDTMEGRCPVAFVALAIQSELNRQLAKRRDFPDKRKKPIHPNTYSLEDVMTKTRSIELAYDARTRKYRLNGVPRLCIDRICEACGTPGAYEHLPAYITNPMDLRQC